MNYTLNEKDFKIAQELANLFYWMDKDPRSVSNEDISRLYGEAARNPKIHYYALEINKAKHKKSRLKNGVR